LILKYIIVFRWYFI